MRVEQAHPPPPTHIASASLGDAAAAAPRSEEAEHLEHAVPRARRELAAVRREVDRRVKIDELLRITLQYAGEDATACLCYSATDCSVSASFYFFFSACRCHSTVYS